MTDRICLGPNDTIDCNEILHGNANTLRCEECRRLREYALSNIRYQKFANGPVKKRVKKVREVKAETRKPQYKLEPDYKNETITKKWVN